MTKCYLDSNVLIYFKNSGSVNFSRSRDLLSKLEYEGTLLYISPLCLDEFLYQTSKNLKAVGSKNHFSDLKETLTSVLNLPNISIINPPSEINSQLEVIDLMETFSLHPRDAYHLLTMQANEIDGFATFDTDFRKVFQAKLLIKA